MISEIQEALRNQNLDGWLFFDHHCRDPLAYRVLHLNVDPKPSRRWYYLIPAFGEPTKLVHRIEAHRLTSLPGLTAAYSSWQEQRSALGKLLGNVGTIAMQYSPDCAIPYVANVDAGTVELIRSLGVQIVSSADLIQIFEAQWSSDQLASHIEAGKKVDIALRDAFIFLRNELRNDRPITEFDVQQFLRRAFKSAGLFTDHGPIVAINKNASDPHYEPSSSLNSQISKGDLVLIDLWAKLASPGSVYYDITWTGFCGERVPTAIENVFSVVTGARKSASNFVIDQIAEKRPISGWQVDDAARDHIRSHDLDRYFIHRTGHSIGEDVHGNGANMDNFESHDDRKIIPNTCFSIEPGVYLPDFGIRSEVNVFVGADRAWVTGAEQERLVLI